MTHKIFLCLIVLLVSLAAGCGASLQPLTAAAVSELPKDAWVVVDSKTLNVLDKNSFRSRLEAARVIYIGEQHDLSEKKPDVLRRVKARFAAWKKHMNDAEPRRPFRDF